MLKFDWNSLSIGDDVLLHDPERRELNLVPGVVVMVETKTKKSKSGVNGVGIRVAHGGGHRVLWPSYMSVHRELFGLTGSCWRCEALAQDAAPQ